MKALIILLLIATTASAQTDTSKCMVTITNTKKCTTKHIRAYEVTEFNGEEWVRVKFLNQNFKPIRKRRNRCIAFYESLM
jgi:hypothetical protein